MTLRQLFECVQPLSFEDGFEGYEYNSAGTFFFARYRNCYFAITTKHCLRDRNLATIRLFRPNATKGKAFIPINRITVIDDPAEKVCDWADLAFIRLNECILSNEDKIATWFVDLDYLNFKNIQFSKGDILMTKGCPNCVGRIDYDTGAIQRGFVAFEGCYDGKSCDQNVHTLRFAQMKDIPSLNGFSGSPVFKVYQALFRDGIEHCFAGVIIRGTIESGIAHFIDSEVVFRAINELSV
jgi:hypothetical protein